MNVTSPAEIRNVAFIGHGGSGKTTLAETLLHLVGATARQGKVDEGTSLLDSDPEEQKRKISINLALAAIPHERTKINVVDTPGYADFQGEVKAALRVVDAAVVVVEGAAGLQVGTQTGWDYAEERSLPRIVFISRLDRERTNFRTVLDQLRQHYGSKVVALEVPVGEEHGLRGTVNVLHRTYRGKGKAKAEAVPAEAKDLLEEYRTALVEDVAETDDALLEKYLADQELSDDELVKGLHAAVRDAKVIPVIGGSAALEIGLSALLDDIVELLPSPDERGAVIGAAPSGEEIVRKPVPDERFSAFVFKTLADPFVGKLSYARMYSGRLHANAQTYNATRREVERVGTLLSLRGKEQEQLTEVLAGDIVAIPKLPHTSTNDTLADREATIAYPPISFPEPSFAVAIEPVSKQDLDKLSTSLHRLLEEDPSARLLREESTGELLLSGIGESHVDVIVHRMKDKFGVAVTTKTPTVPYRETVRGKAQAQGKYKKQTGGHGQYGDVWLEIEPQPSGTGVVFDERVVGGSVPRNYFPAVEKGVKEASTKGPLAGFPLVDVKVVLFDGSYHSVDSNEMSFKIAASMGLHSAVKEANPVLLEPIYEIEVVMPEEQMGDILGDLNSRRGRILGMDSAGPGHQRVRAYVPLAEIFRYATDLRSMTGGRGRFATKFHQYEEVPAHIAQKVIESAKEEVAAKA
ncbi:MAG: elongation factor G [Chloroflexi bacterium 13_1_40CM_4_68_4]|nr:MAG: elongation factor G [Chloroflexi bacterium 13_1_40CM_4_68_4]